MIYSNFEEIITHDPNNLLNLNKSVLLNKNEKCPNLAKSILLKKTNIKNLIIGDDDIVTHDLGYIKLLIMNNVPYITLPNYHFNNKSPKGVQLDTVRNITEILCAKEAEFALTSAKNRNNSLSLEIEKFNASEK